MKPIAASGWVNHSSNASPAFASSSRCPPSSPTAQFHELTARATGSLITVTYVKPPGLYPSSCTLAL